MQQFFCGDNLNIMWKTENLNKKTHHTIQQYTVLKLSDIYIYTIYIYIYKIT